MSGKEPGDSASGLRPNKRHFTGHDSNGKSIYIDSPPQKYYGLEGFGWVARSFATDSIPAVMKDDADIDKYKNDRGSASFRKRDIVIPGGGVHLVVMDLAPGGESAFHRTKSVDFSICVMGEIEHTLDSGEKVRLLPGVSFTHGLFDTLVD
jgi:hypothetical protein